MKKDTNIFQIVLIALFIIATIGAVIIFSLKKSANRQATATLTVWGDIDKDVFRDATEDLTDGPNPLFDFEYSYVRAEDFESIFIEALAEDRGPDLILYESDVIYTFEDKLSLLPYESYPERAFKDSFVEAAEVFALRDGILALPITIDPLIMYWNRDLMTLAGGTQPPRFWDEVPAITERITERSGSNVTRSGIALGQFDNVDHARDIISMMLLQGGNSIVERNPYSTVVFAPRRSANEALAQSVFRYFSEFSDPSKSIYSWNSSLPNSRSMFVMGDLGFYLGYASEYLTINRSNPSLNFDVVSVPQLRDSERRVTYAQVRGIAVPRKSVQKQGAYRAAVALSNSPVSSRIARLLALPPLHRDLLQETPPEAVMTTFYDSALISRSWINENPRDVSEIFKSVVLSINSGRLKVSEAITEAQERLESIVE